MPAPKEKERCSWCLKDDIYKTYHDEVWGFPEHDDRRLFAKLVLDGAQAGLSWYTILIRTEGYARAFDQWDAERIARYGKKDIERLMKDPGIIRNRQKVESAIKNAQAYLRVSEVFYRNGFEEANGAYPGQKPQIARQACNEYRLLEDHRYDRKWRGAKGFSDTDLPGPVLYNDQHDIADADNPRQDAAQAYKPDKSPDGSKKAVEL